MGDRYVSNLSKLIKTFRYAKWRTMPGREFPPQKQSMLLVTTPATAKMPHRGYPFVEKKQQQKYCPVRWLPFTNWVAA
ncbi:MAG TPA: hypothetical protein DCO83_07165 [Mucilaginibacter sp.]|nr:hypothetical protein [Mucilaginibacter sp.]